MKLLRIISVLTLVCGCGCCGCNRLFAEDKLAQQAKKDLIQNTTFGGYIIGSAKFNDQDYRTHSNFDIRLGRLYVDGKVLDFKYKLQMEINGVSGNKLEKGTRIVDAWLEWQRYSFLKVRFGQFKRAFTFENPMNPWDIGFGNYSQLVVKLAGMGDYVGEHTSGGRDLGVQIQGDLLPVAEDHHNFLHYQVGVYNGQGINHSDLNNKKDVIGGLYFYPVKELAIGAFGWTGSYTRDNITVDRNRMAYGLKYESDWSVRAEYASSQGHRIGDYLQEGEVKGDGKADAWYVCVGAPVAKKCKVYAKWDVFRDGKSFAKQKNLYCLAANYYFYKNLKLQANYQYAYDKNTKGDKSYNTFDLQLYWRF